MQQAPLDVAQDGNLFPREELLDAVAEADWRERHVPLAALASLALGLGLFALALPEPLPTDAAAVIGTATGAPPLHAPHQLAWALTALGMAAERAWYLVSAVGLTLALPALFLVARALGVGGGLALATAGVALAAAAGLGQRPDATTWAVTGTAVVAMALAWRGDTTARDDTRRAIAALALGTWLHPVCGVFAPVVLVALFELHSRDLRRHRSACVAAIAVGGLALLSNVLRGGGLVGPQYLLEPVFGDSVPVTAAELAALGALVAAIFGLTELFRTPEEESEEHAPHWMRAGVVAVMAGGIIGGLPGVALLPLVVLGLAGRINRLADAGSWGRWLLVAIAIACASRATVPWWPAPRSIVIVEAADGGPISLTHTHPYQREMRYVLRYRYGLDPRQVFVK